MCPRTSLGVGSGCWVIVLWQMAPSGLLFVHERIHGVLSHQQHHSYRVIKHESFFRVRLKNKKRAIMRVLCCRLFCSKEQHSAGLCLV